MPCPAFALWVWQASPAMKTRGKRDVHLLLRHVVELVAQALADLVDGPPGDVFDVQRVRMNDPVRGRDQLVGGDVLGRQVLIGVELVELDVEADQVAPLAGDDEDVPLVGGVNRRLEADVREVGDRQDIHDAPRLIGHVAHQRAANRLPDAAARAIAADDVAGPDGFLLPLTVGLHSLQRDRHRVIA